MNDEQRKQADLLKKEIMTTLRLSQNSEESEYSKEQLETLDYRARCQYYENKYNQIRNSGFWKITLPARLLFDFIKGTNVYRKKKEKLSVQENYNKAVCVTGKAAELITAVTAGYDCLAVDFFGGLVTWLFYEKDGFEKYGEWIDRVVTLEDAVKLIVPRNEVFHVCKEISERKLNIIIIAENESEKEFCLTILTRLNISFQYEIIIKEELYKVSRELKVFYWYSGNQTENIEGERLFTPREQFENSVQYSTFQEFINTSLDNSLLLGYAVNVCWYNSPFALGHTRLCKLHSLEMAAGSFFAPLFLKFSEYLEKTAAADDVLLFLAREGWFLQRAYLSYCQAFGKQVNTNYYFLASRRATSVPALQTMEDLDELLNIEYSGRLQTLLRERFGIGECKAEDQPLKLPEDKLKVLEVIKACTEELVVNAEKERAAYMEYIRSVVGAELCDHTFTLVDVGYSGSIQYNLIKMLDIPLDGCYMIEGFEMKPLKIDGTVRGLYNFWNSPCLEKTRLFLEAITAAPFGQLLYFEQKESQVKPVYQKEESIYDDMLPIQNSICNYIEFWGKIVNLKKFKIDRGLVEKLYSEILRPGILDEHLTEHFIVNDAYCMDGKWIYDGVKEDWKICKDGKETYLKDL